MKRVISVKKFWLVFCIILATCVCRGSVLPHYVATNSPSPAFPYWTWDSAAHTIQEAVNACFIGENVIVTDGVYSVGGTRTFTNANYIVTNRVVITNAIYVYSVNGPAVTTIKGQFDPNTGGPGSNAVRCVYLTGGGSLSGFTLTSGATYQGVDIYESSGAGLFVENGTVSNCVITGNKSPDLGGGVLIDSANCLITHCVISDNYSANYGGGVCFNANGKLRNCLVVNNRTHGVGGGVNLFYAGSIENCTIVGNSSTNYGGGLYNSGGTNSTASAVNTIVSGNFSQIGDPEYTAPGTNFFTFSCAQPLPAGNGNIAANPVFIGGGDYHLRPNSPCVNAGTNLSWMTGAKDIDGEPRLREGSVDMGADEAYQFMAIGISNKPNAVLTTWASVTDGKFQMLYAADLVSGIWSNAGGVATSVATHASIIFSNPPPVPVFYRLMYLGP